MNDIRFALRMLLKNPGFTAVAVLSLGLGIGANTTVFSWIQELILRPLPGVVEASRMVVICPRHVSGSNFDTASYPDLIDFAGLTNVMAGVIGSQMTPVCLGTEGQLEWVWAQIVTANYFTVLGVKPEHGRTFLPEEETKPGGHPVVVISHGLWQRRFGGDPAIVGKTIELNRNSFTIVGVVPAEFRGTMSGLRFDLWAPLMMHNRVAGFGSLNYREDRWIHSMARLQPGVTRAQAQTAASVLARQLEIAYPGTNKDIGVTVFPLWKAPYGGTTFFLPVLRVLMTVSAAVLLIVAANIANLLLARATSRQKEIAIRLALGASRLRLVRQLLTESVLLALVGGVAGVLISNWAVELLKQFMPTTHLQIGYELKLDAGSLVFAVLVSVAAGLLFGLAPALQSIRSSMQATLKEGGRTSGLSVGRHPLRNILVIAETALALLLLVGAGLCFKGFQKARRVDIGCDNRNVLLGGLRLAAHNYSEEKGKVFYTQLLERLRALPGVQQAALASYTPLGFEGGSTWGCEIEGYTPVPGERLSAGVSIVSPGYFDTLQIPLLEGRDFNLQDDDKAPRAVVINQYMARKYWPGQSPIGRRMKAGNRPVTVVGVVKNGKYRTLNEPQQSFMYLPYLQGIHDLNLTVHLRTAAPPQTMALPLQRAVQALDRGVQVWVKLSLIDYMQAAFLAHRIATVLLIGLGGVALVLAAMGIYGVMAYSVSQRTHEIGVRMALGAQVGDVLQLVVMQGLALTAIGVGVGLGGALALTRLMTSFLYGVSPLDPVTYLGVALMLSLVTLAACCLPARKAARVDPVVALRYE